MSDAMRFILEAAMIVLAVGMCLAFLRAVKGPRFTDRIVAVNMIGTMTTAVICILSGYLGETALVDVALVYTLLSFLAVVIICHVVTLHHKGRQLYLSRKAKEERDSRVLLFHLGRISFEICAEPDARSCAGRYAWAFSGRAWSFDTGKRHVPYAEICSDCYFFLGFQPDCNAYDCESGTADR